MNARFFAETAAFISSRLLRILVSPGLPRFPKSFPVVVNGLLSGSPGMYQGLAKTTSCGTDECAFLGQVAVDS